MEIRVSLDATDVDRKLLHLHSHQVPFATSVALNEVAKQGQARQHRHMLTTFNVTRPAFVGKAVKIKPFATKRSHEVVLKIEPPGGAGRADVLSKFEDGGTKTARDGGRLAIPVDARRGRTGALSKSQRPKAFNFRLKGSGPTAQVYEGDKRTFMIRRNDGTGGIFQRLGGITAEAAGPLGRDAAGQFTVGSKRKRKGRVRMLYSFARTGRIDDRLEFEDNITGEVRKAWPTAFGRAFERAVRTSTAPMREWGKF